MSSMLEDILLVNNNYRELELRSLPHIEQELTRNLYEVKNFFDIIVSKSQSYHIWDLMDSKVSKNSCILFDNNTYSNKSWEYPLEKLTDHFEALFKALDRLEWMDVHMEELCNSVIGWTGEITAECYQFRFKPDESHKMEYANESCAWFGKWDTETRHMEFSGYYVSIVKGGVYTNCKRSSMPMDECLETPWLIDYMREFVPESII